MSKRCENKKEKDFFSPSLTLGLGLVSPPPARPAFSPPSFFCRAAQSPTHAEVAQRAARLSPALQQLTERVRAPWSPMGGALRSEPSPTSCPDRTRARVIPTARDSRERSLPRTLHPFKYSPQLSPSPNLNPSASRRPVLAEKLR